MKQARIAPALVFSLWLGSIVSCGWTSSAGAVAPPPAPAKNATAGTSGVSGLRAKFENGYRLKPDARFLLAAAEVHAALSGQPPEKARVSWVEGSWSIQYRGEAVGALSDLAGFEEALGLLTGWARTVSRSYSLNPAASADFSPLDENTERLAPALLMEDLQEIDRRWRSGPTPRDAAKAAQSLTLLALETPDQLEVADLLAGKALAALALARSASLEAPAEEALLAHRLGYTAHARNLALGLPESNPVRHLVLEQTGELRRLASRPAAGLLPRYLYLVALASERDTAPWLEFGGGGSFRDEGMDLPVLGTGLALRRFEANPIVTQLLLYQTLEEASRAAGTFGMRKRLTAQLATSFANALQAESHLLTRLLHSVRATSPLPQFESDLGKLSSEGPFLNAAAQRAFYESYFYSALFTLALHSLDARASEPDAQALTDLLGAAPGDYGGQFRDWVGQLSASLSGRGNPDLHIQSLTAFRSLGGPARLRSYRELAGSLGYGDPRISWGAKLLAGGLDSRPSHRQAFSEIAYRDLLDLALAEKLLASLQKDAVGNRGRIQAWQAYFLDRPEALKELLDDPNQDLEARLAALQYLIKDDALPEPEIKAGFEKLIAEDPGRWELRDKYIRHLEDRGDFETALRTARQYLERADHDAGFSVIFAKSAIARNLQSLGRHREAWETIQPSLHSWQAGAMGRAALILQDLGRGEEALDLARKAAGRYPSTPWVIGCLAEILWRQGDYTQAAAALKSRPFGFRDWREELGPRFQKVFPPKADDEASRAFAALVAARIPAQGPQDMVVAVANAGRHELAFRLQSQLKVTRDLGSLELPVRAYGYLKKARGEAAALEWIRSAIPSEMVNPASMAMFREKQYELLWTLIENPDAAFGGDYVWALRAAAARLDPGMASRRQELLDHFGAAGPGPFEDLGRFLLGLIAESDLLQHASNSRKQCEIAYFIGLKAMTENRLPEASDWFHIAVETEQRTAAEYIWAMDELYRWAGRGKSLEAG